MAPLDRLMDLEQGPLGANGPFHVDKLMKYRVPVRDLAPKFFKVSSSRPIHDLAASTLGVYQNDVEHIVLDEVRDHVPAWSHPKVDAGSSLQVPSQIIFRDVFGRDRDPISDVARTVRRVFTVQ